MTLKSDEEIRRVLRDNRVIAVVGLSANPDRPSNAVARYMMAHGYTIIPVNPAETEILGQTCYPDLASIPQKVDIVDCFRKAADTPPLAQAAVAIGARVLWLQLGVSNETAAQTAAAGGLDVVMDRCLEIEHARLLG
ncbi:MAG: CoA-binding protein [Sterolibacterium sp.]|nr:CoA-binding protein [Sterolibacterium sp.]